MKASGKQGWLWHIGQVASKGSDLLTSWLVLLIVGIVFWGILVRYLPIYGPWSLWVQHGGIMTLIWLAFIVGGLITRQKGQSGGHYVISIVPDHLPLKARRVVMTIIEILALTLFTVVAIEGIRYCIAVRDAVTTNVQWPFVLYPIPLVLGSLFVITFILNRFISTIKERFQH